jgi:GDPmannose 4,6-dehydratase
MWLMLQQAQAKDFVIATGLASRLHDFVDQVFAQFGLCAQAHVRHNPALKRPLDLQWSVGNPQKALELLGWQAKHRLEDVIKGLCKAHLAGQLA